SDEWLCDGRMGRDLSGCCHFDLLQIPAYNIESITLMTTQHRFALAILGIFLLTSTLPAQVQPPPAPWRGAGPTPCVGSDHGVIKCAPAAQVIAVRAGRLFDSKAGQMLTKQVVVLQG